MSDVIKIAIGGVPCTEKIDAINTIMKHYRNKGLKVLSLGAVSCDNTVGAVIQQIEAENEFNNQIKSCSDDKIIALYDGKIIESFNFLNIEQLGFDLINAWSRYNAAIFFENAQDNRHNSSLLSVWMGHPHLRYIKAYDINAAIEQIDVLVDAIELEKKYLIKYPNLSNLQKYNPFKAEIEQIYLKSDLGSHRIRKRGLNGSYSYFETLKIRIAGDKCFETENIISADEYSNLKKEADPNKHPIVKDRYCFLYEGQYFELDMFPFWNDRALLELELSSSEQKITLPPEIEVIKDVSNDIKYKNNYLASVIFNENS